MKTKQIKQFTDLRKWVVMADWAVDHHCVHLQKTQPLLQCISPSSPGSSKGVSTHLHPSLWEPAISGLLYFHPCPGGYLKELLLLPWWMLFFSKVQPLVLKKPLIHEEWELPSPHWTSKSSILSHISIKLLPSGIWTGARTHLHTEWTIFNLSPTQIHSLQQFPSG